MLTIGLTGGIGSGKSCVAEMFAKLGVVITDTDAIAHMLTAPGQPTLAKIVAAFGERFLFADGSLNRAALRHHIFTDTKARKMLEFLLHPAILQTVKDELTVPVVSTTYRIIVVPLLFESENYLHLIHRSLVIDCSKELQIKRTMARSGLDHAEVSAIIASQISRQDRLAQADDVIVNNSSFEQLSEKVNFMHEKYIKYCMDIDPTS